jgi:hypothetical protein
VASGTVTYSSIDGNSVATPVGRFNVSRTVKRDYSAVGFVRGPGGSMNCYAQYSIGDPSTPPPLPDFAVVPSHCGANVYPESGVKSACLAGVKRDSAWKEQFISQTVLVNYTDNSQEVLPLLAKTSPTAAGFEDWTLYMGALTKATSAIADTKKATLTFSKPRQSSRFIGRAQ